MNYLDRAVSSLSKIGIQFPPQEAPIVALLEKSAKYDANLVTAIAATLQQASTFNAVVREQIDGMQIATRYADITTRFDSIRDDAQKMVSWMDDGRLDLNEKLQMAWMKVRRGSVPDRFTDIRDSYLDVARSARDQIDREALILEAYRDFRMALKAAEVDAQKLLLIADATVAAKKTNLDDASKAVTPEATANMDAAQRSELELKRDEALRALQDEDRVFQLVKNLADDLKTGYNTAELVFARLQQTHDVKERLYQRSVSFFATNEVVFTGLAASFTAMSGLGEATNTMEAMKDGMNKGLEALAKTGGEQLNAGMRSAYGSTLQAGSVKLLADAVVQFQANSMQLIKDLRDQSTRAAAEIEAASEDAKRRYAALLTAGA